MQVMTSHMELGLSGSNSGIGPNPYLALWWLFTGTARARRSAAKKTPITRASSAETGLASNPSLRRISFLLTATLNSTSSADTTIPVRGCSLFSASEYVVTVGVGSPSQDLTFALDTAADLTWVQCKPCAVYCYLQKDLLFDPSKIDDVLQRFLLLPGMISLVTCGTRPLSVRTSQSNHSEA
uniref:Peptidase A1 domain-containing protein n=1 Tax=Ananas comosus var. bracteatus TaxID=296719 RepID=A0A6V7P5T1_ANACO|nr:unnamed protein product [Ananas comosus var. bracteatus]